MVIVYELLNILGQSMDISHLVKFRFLLSQGAQQSATCSAQQWPSMNMLAGGYGLSSLRLVTVVKYCQ